MQKPSLPKGTRDFGPSQSAKRKHITDIIERRFQLFGFSKIETPAMEQLTVLTGKYGDEGDQLIFKILNSGDYLAKVDLHEHLNSKELTPQISEKALRYDLTVPFARFVVMNQNDISFPFKRYQIQPVWRADRPQKGRYREFYQCDADIIGSKGIWNEVDLTHLITGVFSDLKLVDYTINVNHRGVLFAIADKVGLSGNEGVFCTILDKIDKIGREKVEAELGEFGAEKEKLNEFLNIAAEQEWTKAFQSISSFLGDSDELENLSKYFDLLQPLGKTNHVKLDLSLARGLSYYTGMIYEVKPTSVKMGSICGGGRYDDLTGIFGLKDTSGVGISFGLDRIYDVLEELNLFPENVENTVEVLITPISEKVLKYSAALLNTLRMAGIKSEMYPEPAKLKKQLSYANKSKIPFVITIGEDELIQKKYPLKDMRSGKVEVLNVEEIIAALN